MNTTANETPNARKLFNENTVYKTNRYELFKELQGNRPLNPQHIERLVDSIKNNGMLINPILVNENFEIIDGQHRFQGAVKAKKPLYIQFVFDYNLDKVHTLNLNQSNWTSKDYMYGYAAMGLEDYVLLKEFYEEQEVFTLTDCISMCSNVTSGAQFTVAENYRKNKRANATQTFNEGTWKVKNLEKANEYAKNLKEIGKYFEGYNKTSFVGTMIGMYKKPHFSHEEFIKNLSRKSHMLHIAPTREQYKVMVEDIYNMHRRDKINLRF